ncbi:MAG: protein-disulfide reductase DsbD domain-containing protein [Aurantimonas endophytica]|uniref:protein-disulfide reductase DsbD domain-containing protein n=1 Tax=Aurantimonas endophytica TaxID=1522175 RepID=UPI003002B4F3
MRFLENRFAATLICVLMTTGLAEAGSVGAAAPEPMTVRLTTAPAGADGSVRGALLLDLAPGWKTYWVDPGTSGIPPTIDFAATSGLGHAELHFPAPHRFGEGLARANGYNRSLAVAFELAPAAGAELGPVAASVMMGVCREICVPVQATLTTAEADAGAVQAAFAALPERGEAPAELASARLAGDMLTVAITRPEQGGTSAPRDDADLFVAGPAGWYFDEPDAPARQGDRLVFQVPVLERPRGEAGPPERVDVVFTDGAGALEAKGLAVAPSR